MTDGGINYLDLFLLLIFLYYIILYIFKKTRTSIQDFGYGSVLYYCIIPVLL